MVVKTSTFVGMSANCDLTSNWAPLKSVPGQRLYTIQRRRLVSANNWIDEDAFCMNLGTMNNIFPINIL